MRLSSPARQDARLWELKVISHPDGPFGTISRKVGPRKRSSARMPGIEGTEWLDSTMIKGECKKPVLRWRIRLGSSCTFTSDFSAKQAGICPSAVPWIGFESIQRESRPSINAHTVGPDGAGAALAGLGSLRMVAFYGSIGNLGISRQRHFWPGRCQNCVVCPVGLTLSCDD